MRDSLTLGTAEEAAIDQYLRDKAEDEIGSGDRGFIDWFLDKHELADDDIFSLILSALQFNAEINTYADRLRNEYIEARIENRDARADAYRDLFEETSDVG